VSNLHYRELAIQRRWEEGQYTSARWQIIRDAYSLRLPHILQTGTSPYFLDWWNAFTPIERYAWQDIRGRGLKLYPQFPALRYFIDFADPVLQIGVELDGKAFHDEHKDRARDAELWEQGWRIFRIPGRESLPCPSGYPWESDDWPDLDHEDRVRSYCDWSLRWSEGFFWALQVVYYGGRVPHEDYRIAAYRSLNNHRYEQFELDVDEEDEAA
jgi:hypothetical protein